MRKRVRLATAPRARERAWDRDRIGGYLTEVDRRQVQRTGVGADRVEVEAAAFMVASAEAVNERDEDEEVADKERQCGLVCDHRRCM